MKENICIINLPLSCNTFQHQLTVLYVEIELQS